MFMQIHKKLVIILSEVNELSEYINESADIFNDDDVNAPKPPLFIRIIKWIGVAIIIVIIACLLYRCVTHRFEPEVSSKVIMDDEFVEMYENDPESVEVRRYGIQQPWVDVAERQGRLMEIKHLYHIPATNKLLVTMKYNVDIVPEEYSELPLSGSSDNMSGIPFEISLVDETKKEYSSFVYETGKGERFRYIRLCFDGVAMETGELDEEGNPERHSFYIKMKKIDKDGKYEDVCLGGMHQIYDGTEEKSLAFDEVKVKIK